MKRLNEYIKESLLDVDDFDLDKAIKNDVKSFLKANYKGRYSISKNPNADGKYVVDSKGNIEIKNKSITNLTNGCFVWGKVDGEFDCIYCTSLTSLEGAPKEVGGSFSCNGCRSLKTLKGAPEKVGEGFICSYCNSLTSLEGAPKEVGGGFHCTNCCIKFIEDDVRKVSNVKGKINC